MSNEAPAGHLRDAQSLQQLGLRHAVAHAHLVYNTLYIMLTLTLRAVLQNMCQPTYLLAYLTTHARAYLLTYLPLTLMLSTVLMSLGSFLSSRTRSYFHPPRRTLG